MIRVKEEKLSLPGTDTTYSSVIRLALGEMQHVYGLNPPRPPIPSLIDAWHLYLLIMLPLLMPVTYAQHSHRIRLKLTSDSNSRLLPTLVAHAWCLRLLFTLHSHACYIRLTLILDNHAWYMPHTWLQC